MIIKSDINKVILTCQYYVFLISAIRIKKNGGRFRKPVRKYGATRAKSTRKERSSSKGKSFTEAKRKVSRHNSHTQVSLAPGDQQDYLRWDKQTKEGITRQSLLVSILAPGVIPILTTSPSSHLGRRMINKNAMWASHDFESWSKCLQFCSGWDNICSNIDMYLIEAFGPEDARRIANLAPIRLNSQELNMEGQKNTCMPVILVALSHRLQANVYHLS